MYNVKPPLSHLPSAPATVDTCAIFDASALLYQPTVRAAVVQEQAALLETRLAVARWTSGTETPFSPEGHATPPFRAAFYARAQDDFFAWIARGGVWEADAAVTVEDPAASNADNRTVQ